MHSATITFTDWPEYGEMIGGYFDEHPWGTFDAPILVEDPNFPGMQQWPKSFVLKDEIYQMKDFSRDKVRVLMRLDATKLDLNNPRVHRKDLDFAVTWAKMYGKGRVYYSTLGHVEQNWDDPRMQKMFVEAIKWAMGLVDADVTPRPLPHPIRPAEFTAIAGMARYTAPQECHSQASSWCQCKIVFSRTREGGLNQMWRMIFSLLLAFAVLAQTTHPILPLGSPAPDFSLPGVDGKIHQPCRLRSQSGPGRRIHLQSLPDRANVRAAHPAIGNGLP